MRSVIVASSMFIMLLSLVLLGCGTEEKAGEATFYVQDSDGSVMGAEVVAGQQQDIREDNVRVARPAARVDDREAIAVQDQEPVDLGGSDVSGETAAGAQDASDIPGLPSADGAEEGDGSDSGDPVEETN